MRAVRIGFLLLLAALLPIRGAVAAAMLCPIGSTGMQYELRVHENAIGHEETGAFMAHNEAAVHAHAQAGHGHDQAATDGCNLCAAYCALTPLVGGTSILPEPPDLPAVKFADHAAPPPSFVSDGQERPPRTI